MAHVQDRIVLFATQLPSGEHLKFEIVMSKKKKIFGVFVVTGIYRTTGDPFEKSFTIALEHISRIAEILKAASNTLGKIDSGLADLAWLKPYAKEE